MMTAIDTALQDLPLGLRTLAAEPMLVIKLEISAPYNVGKAPSGERRLVVVNGGTFIGPDDLRGSIAPGGNDSVTVRGDGSVLLDARIILNTDAGETILMTYSGLRTGDPATMQRLANGENVDPADYYFRIWGTCETSSSTLSWMNNVLVVGKGHRQAQTIAYSVFRVS